MTIEFSTLAVALRYKLRTARRTAGEIANARRRGGLGAALRQLAAIGTRLIQWYQPVSVWRRHRKNGFDRRYGVDTSGLVHPSRFAALGASGADPHHYKAVRPEDFREALGSLTIRHGDFEFVDYGSGKGRALLLASEYPFRRITGVEFAPELHQAALRNIARFRSELQRCFEIASICTDAATFEPPEPPCVLFFYDPFGERIMSDVLDRIGESLRRSPREMYVVYCQPRLREMMSARGYLEEAASGEHFVVFRALPGSRGGSRSDAASLLAHRPATETRLEAIPG